MNLLNLVNEKSTLLINTVDDKGISSVINHIDVAMKHYDTAKDGSDYLFNDVVYRCNQAYEGSLKEAYRVIAKKNHKKKTPNDIEKYFEDSEILKERVLTLLQNYRKEWRNMSTHDYQLVFSDQEAFLAIVNISAFTNILFDQMLHTKAFDEETELLNKSGAKPKIETGLNFVQNITNALEKYRYETLLGPSGSAMKVVNEIQINGSLNAYLSQLGDNIDVINEYSINRSDSNSRKYIADFLLSNGDEQCIIEVKNIRNNNRNILGSGKEQLMNYLIHSDIKTGILYLANTNANEFSTTEEIRLIGSNEYKLYIVQAEI